MARIISGHVRGVARIISGSVFSVVSAGMYSDAKPCGKGA